MEVKASGLPLTLAAVSVAALVAGLSGHALALGVCAVALLVGLCLLGLRSPGQPSARTVSALLAFAFAFCALLVLAGRLHKPSEPVQTLGGIPPGTAMLLYGIAPLGLTIGLIYGATFSSEVLPDQRLRDFLSRHAKK